MGAWRGDRGQATVELALVLPVVALLALSLVQVTVVAHRQVLVVHAAREGARAAAVAASDRSAAAAQGVARAGGLDPSRISVHADATAGRVRVEVRYREPTDVALVGRVLPPLELTAATTMWIERP